MRTTGVPGDKSLTHRALVLASLARGPSRLEGLLAARDTEATAGALRALGAGVPPLPGGGSGIRVEGVGLRGLRTPDEPLDCANSGTTARMLLGLLAPQGIEATVTGDASLRARPMGRVVEPLARMGGRFQWLEREGVLPVRVRGGSLRPSEHRLAVASAQVKTALLLAGLAGGVPVSVHEPGRSRDHTERMLRWLGVPVSSRRDRDADGPGGWWARLTDPPPELPGFDYRVPGDFSSAAFLVALALLGGTRDGGLRIPDVGLNPTRTGLLGVLERMGASVRAVPAPPDEGISGEGAPSGGSSGAQAPHGEVGEPRGELVAEPSELEATEVDAAEVPGMVDEIPILAVLAARARGVTRITGAGELRVKETDRVRALATNLSRVGVGVEELADGLEIRGTREPLEGRVDAHGDHRIAMAFGVLGALPENAVEVEDPGVVEVSYPAFWGELARLSGTDPRVAARSLEEVSRPGIVVTIDGPAASGKSSTARAVARRLGLPHLDSGIFYRAVTHALLAGGFPEDGWGDLEAADLDGLGLEMSLDRRGGARVSLHGRDISAELRRPEVTARVSHLAARPEVRAWLLPRFREAAREAGAVADGRDLGTVVFPRADVKIYLTADLEERARRRLLEEGGDPDPDAVTAEAERLRERDRSDSGREVAPLRCPEDAAVVDTTGLDFEEQVDAVVERVRSLTGSAGGR